MEMEMIINKITQTGLLLYFVLLIPSVLKDAMEPPFWVQAVIVITGIAGMVVAFTGAMVLIWI